MTRFARDPIPIKILPSAMSLRQDDPRTQHYNLQPRPPSGRLARRLQHCAPSFPTRLDDTNNLRCGPAVRCAWFT
jgi:hypothetical protein